MTSSQKNDEMKTDRGDEPRSVSPYKAGLSCACPSCGKGPLFKATFDLDVCDKCGICGFDLSAADPGDGAQVFVIFIMGTLCALIGFLLYAVTDIPKGLIAAILFTFILVGSFWMLRVFKATLVALQFHHDAREGRMEGDDKP